MRQLFRIVVFGCGRVGLTTAAGFAGFGNAVIAVDIDAALVSRLSCGDFEGMYEPGLAECVRKQVTAGRLRFTSDAEGAVPGAQLIFVAVGVSARSDGSVDSSAVDAVAHLLAVSANAAVPVVIQSTVPAGTAKRTRALLQASLTDPLASAAVLVCPAFMRQGSALADFVAPARIVVGDDSPDGAACRTLLQACTPMIEGGAAVLKMDTRSAELSKQAANAMLAARISFMNEIAAIATATGADIEKVCQGIGSDRRIGMACLRPGLGYGGLSLARDVAALRETARQHNVRADLLLATERVNDRQRCWAFRALRRDFGPQPELRGLRVAVWGLTFKPGSDDIRNAPSLVLIERLVRAGVTVVLFDPVALVEAQIKIAAHRRIAWARSAEQALDGADVLMLVTDWPEFADFDPTVAFTALRLRTVYDCRNALDEKRWVAAGLRVVQVGRPEGQTAMPLRRTPNRDPAPIEQPKARRAPAHFAFDPLGWAA